MKHSSLLIFAGVMAAAGLGLSLTDHSTTSAIARELAMASADPANSAPWATLVRDEIASLDRRKVAVFAMPCFWSGEGHFGLQSGVYATRPGFLAGREVVEVSYDPKQLTYVDLVRAAHETGVVTHIFCRDDADLAIARSIAGNDAILNTAAIRADDQPKWYLQQSALRALPLTPAQRTRVNALLHDRQPIDLMLSPTQAALAKQLQDADRDAHENLSADDSLLEAVQRAMPGHSQ